MKLNRKISWTLLSAVVAASLGSVNPAEAAVVTGGKAFGGFSVISNEFFSQQNQAKAVAEESLTTELFSKATVPDGIAFTDDTTTALNIRSGPGTNYARIGQMGKNCYCIVESIENGWAKVTSGKVSGYCFAEYLITGKAADMIALSLGSMVATVKPNVSSLNVRSAPDTTVDNIIAKVSGGQNFKVTKEVVLSKNDPEAKTFVQIEWNSDTSEDSEAYVSADYVDVTYKYKEAVECSNYGYGVSQLRTNMIDFAMKYLGTPYVWGGNSLTRGVDCSGFVKQVFLQYGYGKNMPRTARDMAAKYSKVSSSEAKAGDLVFYHNLRTGVVDHVAIYIGNGKIIHSCNGVEISNVNYRTIYKYARVIWD